MDINIAISNAQSFSELLPIAKQAEDGVKLSCLGRKYIVANEYAGEAPIDTLAEKVIELIQENIEFNDQERTFGKELAERIDHIYDLSEEQVQNCNCITKIFLWLRNLPHCIWMIWTCGEDNRETIWKWRDCERWNMVGFNKSFDYYTRNQFTEKFGYPPENTPRGYRCGKYASGSLNRWRAPEKVSTA